LEQAVDTILLLSIFLVFITALVGSFIQRRKRDKVLADLQGFHAVARMQNDERIWGQMEVYPNGLELVYAQPFQNHRGHLTTSFILFRDGIDQVQSLYRFHSELTPENQLRREKEIELTHNPGMLRIALRRVKNFLNTFRDAINESMGMLLTRMKGTSSMSLFRTQDDRLKKIGSEALGSVGNAYDPILEHYIGKPVVVELETAAGEKEEYAGLLREYSQSWLSVFDCRVREEARLPLGDPLRLSIQRDLDFWIHVDHSSKQPGHFDMKLKIQCYSSQVIYCKQVEGGDFLFPVESYLRKGESFECILEAIPEALMAQYKTDVWPVEFTLIAPERLAPMAENKTSMPMSNTGLPNLELVIESERAVDIFAPRALAVLRHGGSAAVHSM
jgi:hypothetical protein